MGLDKLEYMGWVIRETLFEKLTSIEAKDKELNGTKQRMWATRKQRDRRARRAR